MEPTLFIFIMHTQFPLLNYITIKRKYLSKQNKRNTGFIYYTFQNSLSLGIVSGKTVVLYTSRIEHSIVHH